MANNITQNPLSIDTAGASVLWQGMLKINHIEFTGYALATDTATIKNAQGLVVCQLRGATDLEEVRSGKIGSCQGLIVDQLSSGTVRIYIE